MDFHMDNSILKNEDTIRAKTGKKGERVIEWAFVFILTIGWGVLVGPPIRRLWGPPTCWVCGVLNVSM